MLVVLTEWNEFRAIDLKKVLDVMRGDVLVDLRNVYSEGLAAANGFIYRGIGVGRLRRAGNGASSWSPELAQGATNPVL